MEPNEPTQAQVPESYSLPGHYVDSDAPALRAFTDRALHGLGKTAPPREKAIRLFDAVRDGLRYDPFTYDLRPAAYRASAIAGQDAAFCVPKAILLTACLRAAGIPAALGVQSHYVVGWIDIESFRL